MAHEAQQNWCLSVKARFPEHFTGKRVLDVGSLNINGDNRYLFTDCEYTGIDVAPGPNVDIVTPAHLHKGSDYDTIISTEAAEHDLHWMATFKAVRRMLRSGGMFVGTCATTGRPEHGTTRTTPGDAPGLPWADYYRNVTEEDIRWVYGEHYPMEGWGAHEFVVQGVDLYFWMIRV